MSGVLRWLEDRTGLASIVRRVLRGRVERRGAWLRTTGMACVVLVLVEFITGPILGLYYTPHPTQAYDDILAINANPMGRFLRGLHHYASAALIILSALTVARMFFMHDYKRRHDLIWVITILFLQLVLMFQLTGHILPWDTNAASTAGVEAGFAGNVWGIGPAIKRFILGGSAVGGATLTRWYGFHALLFPFIFLTVIMVPLIGYRLRHAETGEDPAAPELPEGWEVKAPEPPPATDPYYPVHLAREMVVALGVFLTVAALAVFKRAPLELQATADNLAGYDAYSEWYVLPLHALTLLPPFNRVAFEPIATIVVPGALVVTLMALPFLYRMRSRPAFHRPVVPLIGMTVIASAAGLFLFAFIRERPQAIKQMEMIAIRMGEKQILLDTSLVARGKGAYADNGCNACHAIAGQGGKNGPDLSKAGLLHPDRDWQIQHLVKPESKVPGSTMPAYGHLKQDQIRALAEYMLSLR